MLTQNFEPDGLFTASQASSNLRKEDGHPQTSGFQLYKTVTGLMRAHRYTAVLLELAEAAADHHHECRFWHLQGEALANLGRYQDALTSFSRALSLDPDSVDTLVFQAVCWIHLQDFNQALGCCDRALTISPQDAQAWLFRGVALQRLGKYQAAYSSYDHALNTNRPTFWRRLITALNRWLRIRNIKRYIRSR